MTHTHIHTHTHSHTHTHTHTHIYIYIYVCVCVCVCVCECVYIYIYIYIYTHTHTHTHIHTHTYKGHTILKFPIESYFKSNVRTFSDQIEYQISNIMRTFNNQVSHSIQLVKRDPIHERNLEPRYLLRETCIVGDSWIVVGRKDMFYLTTHSTHCIYGYMAIRHMVKDHSDSERGNPLPPHGLLFQISSKVFFYMHHPTDRMTHTTVFVTPFVEHWLEREIAQWVHHEGSIRRPIAS